MSRQKPVVLIIRDGWAHNEAHEGNAVYLADPRNWKKLWENNPHTFLQTSGGAVGLPDGLMGNSEVGHLNIGAGRIVKQEITRINDAIKDGSFFENKAFNKAMEHAIKNNSQVHLMGLFSDGGVHSDMPHIKALFELAKKKGIDRVYLHAFMDGRDTPPDSGVKYIAEFEEYLKELGVGKIATISGRHNSMDRDTRWERTKIGYDAMVSGVGEKATDAVKAIKESYKKQYEENPDKPGSDERIDPIIMVDDKGEPVATIKDGDSAIIFNFRADRVRQMSRALGRDDFEGFEREQIKDLVLVTMTEYDEEFDFPVAFPPVRLTKIFGEVISEMGLNQLRIAETEKYAHVTYFFNGGEETPFKNEDRALIPSPKVATYNLKPEMSAYEVTDELIKRIESDKYDVIICNYANADMVGHTGVLEAAIKAVKVVDECQQKVVDVVMAKGGVVLLTTDHGNSDQMIDPVTGGPFTAHTTFPAPLVITGLKEDVELKEGALCDIAPTILDIMGIDKPDEMTGQSLIVK